MSKVELVGTIDSIMHDHEKGTSIVWIRVGREFVTVERPMKRRFEWSPRHRNETVVKSGDQVRLLLEKVAK